MIISDYNPNFMKILFKKQICDNDIYSLFKTTNKPNLIVKILCILNTGSLKRFLKFQANLFNRLVYLNQSFHINKLTNKPKSDFL